LGNIFQSLIECPQVHELVEAGHLVPTRVFAPTKPDLEGVRIKMGDYVEADLGERMDDPKLIGDIVEHWHRLAGRQRTVVFAVNVAHSVHIRDEFLRSGVAAEHLDGKTPADERDGILKRLADGVTEVVTNCQVLTEGWDCPSASCLVLARPTKSVGLYRQMAGRVLRPSDGKTHALIIDHAGAVHEHGFIDEPVEWVLSEDRRASHPRQEARKQGRAPMLVECPECGAIRWEGQPCTACGWRGRTKGSPVNVLDGELAELDRRRQAIEASKLVPQTFYCELMAIAETRGYSPGWAYHKYLEKFKGTKPPWSWRNLPPIAPSDATLAWVRSRQIAWAKSRRRAA
jgi:superfamily II DNA or RNA helicase